MSKQLTTDSLKKSASQFLRVVNRYRSIIFFLVLASLYGFIIWRINVLSTAPPSEADIKSAEQTAVPSPKIDAASARAINNLKDNSVRVQTLFEDARNNPFNE